MGTRIYRRRRFKYKPRLSHVWLIRIVDSSAVSGETFVAWDTTAMAPAELPARGLEGVRYPFWERAVSVPM